MTETKINKETMNLNKYIQAYNNKRGAIQTELKPIEKDIINTISDAMICLDLAEPGNIEINDNHITIYANEGFHGVIRKIESKLEYGSVEAKEDGLFCITTSGWSDDEEILDSLTSFLSLFGNKHYVGRIRGGAYYFAEDNHSNYYEIVKEGEEKVTRQEALELLLRWAVECDFGLDNIALDFHGDWNESRVQRNEFEERTKDMSYTESLIEYARIYLEQIPEPLEEGE